MIVQYLFSHKGHVNFFQPVNCCYIFVNYFKFNVVLVAGEMLVLQSTL